MSKLSHLLESSYYNKHHPKMRQYGSSLFLAVFLGLVCIGHATPLNVTAYQLRLSLLGESCRTSDAGAQRFYKQRRQNDTRYYGFSGGKQLPSKSTYLPYKIYAINYVMQVRESVKPAERIFFSAVGVVRKCVPRSPGGLSSVYSCTRTIADAGDCMRVLARAR